MRKILTLVLLIILSGISAYAQKETNIWYFGIKAGVDFRSGKPVALSDGVLQTNEGCATICDKNGNLLFYTDGSKIWNRRHQTMPNGTGLRGSSTTTQSAVIVKLPESDSIYYVFTISPQCRSGVGLAYSIVDLGAGFQDGAVTKKNINLKSQMTERLTAVAHSNGTDIWIIGRSCNGNEFYTYLLTKDGITNAPVKSNAGGTYNSISGSDAIGYMKASPDGKLIAFVTYESNHLELLEFDNTSGKITSKIIHTSFDYEGLYGLEFSPGGSKLYISNYKESSDIYQFDLKSLDPDDFESSRKNITHKGLSRTYSALQTGPDGKIYSSIQGSSYLNVINEPDKSGAFCDYEENAVYLGANRKCALGLPNYVVSYIVQGCGEGSFEYPEFKVSEGVLLKGKAKIDAPVLRLTEDELQTASAVWIEEPVPVKGSFHTEFSFRMSDAYNGFDDGSRDGADGLALVFQDQGTNELGKPGGGLGYKGILNCVAVEFDTYRNRDKSYNDPDGNHAAIFHLFETDKTNGHGSSSDLITNENIIDIIPDGRSYYVRIEYDYKQFRLKVYLDETGNYGETSKILELTGFDFGDKLNLIDGDRAYIGLTSATGTSYEKHDILSWVYCYESGQPITGIEETKSYYDNGFYANPNPLSGLCNLDFNVGRAGFVNLSIYDRMGNKIDELFSETMAAGHHSIKWDSRKYPSGMYFAKLQKGNDITVLNLSVYR